jgi:hypothetical protein
MDQELEEQRKAIENARRNYTVSKREHLKKNLLAAQMTEQEAEQHIIKSTLHEHVVD